MPRYNGPLTRRIWLLQRLRDADGPEYGDLVGEVIARFPEKTRYWAGVQAARSARQVLWDELATVDRDGAIWLTPAGWQAAEKSA